MREGKSEEKNRKKIFSTSNVFSLCQKQTSFVVEIIRKNFHTFYTSAPLLLDLGEKKKNIQLEELPAPTRRLGR